MGHGDAMDWADLDLVCLECGLELRTSSDAFACERGHEVPVVDGVPRFVGAEAYAESFGFEWTRHRYTQVDSRSGRTASRDTFAAKTALQHGDLADRLVLDVGVGSGRFAEIAAHHGAAVSASIRAERSRRPTRTSATRARRAGGPLQPAAPRREVRRRLHDRRAAPHAGLPRRGPAIARLVKPGGILAIWVYRRTRAARASDLYRWIAPRMHERSLYG